MYERRPRNGVAREGEAAPRHGDRPIIAAHDVSVQSVLGHGAAGAGSAGLLFPTATTAVSGAVEGGGTALPGPRAEGQPMPNDFPPVVYLPCVDNVDNLAEAAVEMRQTRDGRIALLAYSALDRLHDKCGADQPWILVPTAELARLQAVQPFQLLLLDI